MRLTSFGIVLVLMTSFFSAQTSAQIPERILFQPGSYAYGPYRGGAAARIAPLQAVPLVADDAVGSAITVAVGDADETEWGQTFGTKDNIVIAGDAEDGDIDTVVGEAVVPVQLELETVPYLAYHRNPWTHRIHVVPYEPGYAAEPEAFPQHQSKFNLWISSLPCREQNRPQVEYADYYDPDPVIIEDKPSRLQLILGYPNGAWTSCCDNRWGHRLAQCPGVDPIALGPYAEIGIQDQQIPPVQPAGYGYYGGQRQLNSAAQPRRGFRGGLRPAPYPGQPGYPAAGYPGYPGTGYPAAYPYQYGQNGQIVPQVPYPPYTAQSIFHSRFAAPNPVCPECEKAELVCTCRDNEENTASCKYCKHRKSCESCRSVELADDGCGTAHSSRRLLKKNKGK